MRGKDVQRKDNARMVAVVRRNRRNLRQQERRQEMKAESALVVEEGNKKREKVGIRLTCQTKRRWTKSAQYEKTLE